MTKVILRVLILLVIIGYAALFISWNPDYVTVCGGMWPPEPQGERWVQELPLGYLPLIGAVGGVILMAIVAWGEWSHQKATSDQARAQVQKAKVKLQELVDRIKRQRAQIDQLEQQLAEAKSAPAAEPPGKEVEPSEEASSSAPQQ